MYFKDFISNCFYLTIVVIYGTQELENDITDQGGVVSHTENQEYHFINLVAVVYEISIYKLWRMFFRGIYANERCGSYLCAIEVGLKEPERECILT